MRQLLNKIKRRLVSRPVSQNIYAGLELTREEVDVLERARCSQGSLIPTAECFTNFCGLITRADVIPGQQHRANTVSYDLPIPSDGIYGDVFEYIATLQAVESCQRNQFVAVELGAGWGPWSSLAAMMAKKQGKKNISVIAVEADTERSSFIRPHFTLNRLEDVNLTVVNGAAWSEAKTLNFPRIDPRVDYGATVRESHQAQDHFGRTVPMVKVRGHTIPEICKGYEFIDFMHWDIQGAEWPVAAAAIEYLNKHVKHMFIGTHSRTIEGHLLQLFFDHSWSIKKLHPCVFNYDATLPTLEAMTIADGSMVVVNHRI